VGQYVVVADALDAVREAAWLLGRCRDVVPALVCQSLLLAAAWQWQALAAVCAVVAVAADEFRSLSWVPRVCCFAGDPLHEVRAGRRLQGGDGAACGLGPCKLQAATASRSSGAQDAGGESGDWPDWSTESTSGSQAYGLAGLSFSSTDDLAALSAASQKHRANVVAFVAMFMRRCRQTEAEAR